MQLVFLPIFNTLYMCPKIQCDGESYKIFGILKEVNTALITHQHTPACSVIANQPTMQRGRSQLTKLSPFFAQKTQEDLLGTT
jgi:hypothetical protein